MTTKQYYTHQQVLELAALLGASLGLTRTSKVFGIPRGGTYVAYAIASAVGCQVVDHPEDADAIVDDLIDSGATMNRYVQKHPDKKFGALIAKPTVGASHLMSFAVATPHLAHSTSWIVFPWEVREAGHDDSAEDAVVRMMQAIGENPDREGLKETPKRVVKAWQTWFKGYAEDPADYLKTFTDGADGCDEMVLLTNIPVYSHCEHHITPFLGIAHVAYIPNGKIVGISKLARVVDTFARRLQVQERLTNQIADCLNDHLKPLGVGVIIKAKHMCMVTRGVQTPNVDTTTSALRGVFFDNQNTRQEFINLALAAEK